MDIIRIYMVGFFLELVFFLPTNAMACVHAGWETVPDWSVDVNGDLVVNDGGIILQIAGVQTLLNSNRAHRIKDALSEANSLHYCPLESTRDRYRRIPAEIRFTNRDDEDKHLQHSMLRRGMAIVAPVGDGNFIQQLLRSERIARRERLGIWKNPYAHGPIKSAHDQKFADDIGQYRIVAGRIWSISRLHDIVYLNFGKNWRKDFTTIISKDMIGLISNKFAAQEITLEQLQGKPVLVRGWIVARNGPAIEVTHPEQIELKVAETIRSQTNAIP